MKKSLSVVVPAYNESRKISQTLSETVDYLARRQYDFEILVINDGSTDTTADQVRGLAEQHSQIRLLDNKMNFGKGKAVKQGVREARCAYCLFMDADNSTSIREWDKFEKCFDQGFRAVIASRHLTGSRIIKPQPLARRFFGAGYRALCRFLFGLRVSDLNCGFKAYETPLAKRIYSEIVMNDWTFDAEVLCRLKKEGVEIAEVPVAWAHEGGKSHAAVSKTILAAFGSVLRLKRLLAN